MKNDFQINVGCVDSFIRIFVGLCFVASALMGLLGMWALAGGVLVITGMARYCPGYLLFGFNSCRYNPEK